MTAHSARPSRPIKGALAIGAGVLLLAGGVGTYAYWSASVPVDAGTIESGDLGLELGDLPGVWSLAGVLGAPIAVPATDLADVRLVPGDVLTLTQVIDVTLVGDTLAADLSVDASGLGLDPDSNFAVGLTVDGVTSTGVNTFRLTPETAEDPLEVELTIEFEPDLAPGAGVYDANVSLDLSDGVEFTLIQATS